MELDGAMLIMVQVFSLIAFSTLAMLDSSLLTLKPEYVKSLVAESKPGSKSIETLFSVPMGSNASLIILKFLVATAALACSTLLSVKYLAYL